MTYLCINNEGRNELLLLKINQVMGTAVTVVRYSRKKKLGDNSSPTIYLLKQEAGTSKVYDLATLAANIESLGALSAEDVMHVLQSFVREIKTVLKRGDRVRVDGLGTFFISLTCPGVEEEKKCTVKSIKRVNIRFKVDNTLRLVNDSTATTRSAPNNVQFAVKGETPEDEGGGSGSGGGGGVVDPME